MWKKLAAMVSASLTVASCQTAMYKPIICEPGTALRQGKCQPVQKAKAPQPKAKQAPPSSLLDQRVQQPPKQNVYGQPL